jgi:hypothetical protein
MESIVPLTPQLLRIADMVMAGTRPPLSDWHGDVRRRDERVEVVLRALLSRGIIPPMTTYNAVMLSVVLASLYHRTREAWDWYRVDVMDIAADVYDAPVFAELTIQTLQALCATRLGRTRNALLDEPLPLYEHKWLKQLIQAWILVGAKRYIDTGKLPAGMSFADLALRHRRYYDTELAERLFKAYLDRIQAGNEVADRETVAAIVQDTRCDYYPPFTDAIRQRAQDAMHAVEEGERYARRYEWLALVNRAVRAADTPASERRVRHRR